MRCENICKIKICILNHNPMVQFMMQFGCSLSASALKLHHWYHTQWIFVYGLHIISGWNAPLNMQIMCSLWCSLNEIAPKLHRWYHTQWIFGYGLHITSCWHATLNMHMMCSLWGSLSEITFKLHHKLHLVLYCRLCNFALVDDECIIRHIA